MLANAQAIKESAEVKMAEHSKRIAKVEWDIKNSFYFLSSLIGREEAKRFMRDLVNLPF